MTFRIVGIDPTPFIALYGLDDESLRQAGAVRYTVNNMPGFPDRVEMRDMAIGESALLVNYFHIPQQTPYRSSHAIFIREGAQAQYNSIEIVPEVMKIRTLSVRAFDAEHMMKDAALVEGQHAAELFKKMLACKEVSYLHVHNAIRGCYSGRVERA